MTGAAGEATGERRDWALVVAICVPVAVLSVDFAGVVVALPAIGTDLDVARDRLGWVVSAFALGSAAPLVVAGRLADTSGRRRLL
ncbi:MAG: MFS transporter, partial [Acidimicrobiales bacterium]|nr:MFS transporter [Acidimicrobiales bacterium]